MHINEITKPKHKVPSKMALSRKIPIKGPYAPPPKALPKPKSPTPTPLEQKRNQEKMQQSYANTVLSAFEKNSPQKSIAASEPRSQEEMKTFIKIVRGEIPEKPRL